MGKTYGASSLSRVASVYSGSKQLEILFHMSLFRNVQVLSSVAMAGPLGLDILMYRPVTCLTLSTLDPVVGGRKIGGTLHSGQEYELFKEFNISTLAESA